MACIHVVWCELPAKTMQDFQAIMVFRGAFSIIGHANVGQSWIGPVAFGALRARAMLAVSGCAFFALAGCSHNAAQQDGFPILSQTPAAAANLSDTIPTQFSPEAGKASLNHAAVALNNDPRAAPYGVQYTQNGDPAWAAAIDHTLTNAAGFAPAPAWMANAAWADAIRASTQVPENGARAITAASRSGTPNP